MAKNKKFAKPEVHSALIDIIKFLTDAHYFYESPTDEQKKQIENLHSVFRVIKINFIKQVKKQPMITQDSEEES